MRPGPEAHTARRDGHHHAIDIGLGEPSAFQVAPRPDRQQSPRHDKGRKATVAHREKPRILVVVEGEV